MAYLRVKSPNGSEYALTLDHLAWNSGGIGPTNVCSILPNGAIMSSYAQTGAYQSPNSQRVVWSWNIPYVTFAGAFHLTTSGRPIMFSLAGIDSDGCTLVSWDCASNTAPSTSPVYAYVLAIGHV